MSIRTEYSDRIEWTNENGQYHRVDGPAVEFADGDKYWYLNGKRHRVDGPAIEFADGDKYWYLNNIGYSEQGWKKEVLKIRLKRILEL